MAATTTDPHNAPTYGQRCRDARKNAGLSVEKARDRLREVIPSRYVPSTKTLHRLENGEIDETKVDGLLIYGLAHIYGKKISELSPMVADEYERLGDLLASSSPWTTTATDGDIWDIPVTQCEGQLPLLNVA